MPVLQIMAGALAQRLRDRDYQVEAALSTCMFPVENAAEASMLSFGVHTNREYDVTDRYRFKLADMTYM